MSLISSRESMSDEDVVNEIFRIFVLDGWTKLDGETYHIMPGDPALYYVSKTYCQRLDEVGLHGLSWRETYYVKAVMAMADHIIKEDEKND